MKNFPLPLATMGYDVQDIANKVILQTDVERGDVITNLKLQKLLYYLQGYHLAFFNKRFFNSTIEAWTYGPVLPEVYHRFKENRHLGIEFDNPAEIQNIKLPQKVQSMFDQVMKEYGKFSAIRLMEMTHEEKPWKEAFGKLDKSISTKTMESFFKELIDE
jgi:uncharacterized phage-associated protein